MVQKEATSIAQTTSRDFHGFLLKIDQAVGAGHFALQGRAIDLGFDRFEQSLRIDSFSTLMQAQGKSRYTAAQKFV
jgi:hypothetical protein